MKVKVFISHSHIDSHSATYLQEVLEANNAETFLDQDKIGAGDILPTQIEDGLKWCNIFLILWSAGASQSKWVMRELELAKELGKKIIPYTLDSTPRPLAFKDLVYVSKRDQEHSNAELLKAIFGKEFLPEDPSVLFPGKWKAKQILFNQSMGQMSYELELRANGQLVGTSKVESSGWLGNTIVNEGWGNVLDQTYAIQGHWVFEDKTDTLLLTFSASGMGFQTDEETIRIRTSGNTGAKILEGTDLKGLKYEFERVSPPLQGKNKDKGILIFEDRTFLYSKDIPKAYDVAKIKANILEQSDSIIKGQLTPREFINKCIVTGPVPDTLFERAEAGEIGLYSDSIIEMSKESYIEIGNFMNREFYEKGEYIGAKVCFEAMLIFYPKLDFILNLIGSCFLELKQYDKAIAKYDEIIDVNPNFLTAYMNRAICWHNKGQDDRAEIDLKKVIELDKKEGTPDAKKAIARIQKYKQRALISARLLSSEEIIAKLKKDKELISQNNIEPLEFINKYFVVGEITPKDMTHINVKNLNLGNLLGFDYELYSEIVKFYVSEFSEKRNFLGGRDLLFAISLLTPNDWYRHFEVGRIFYFDHSDFRKAFEHFEKSLKLIPIEKSLEGDPFYGEHPDLYQIYKFMGTCQGKFNNFKIAEDYLKKALEIVPDEKFVLIDLAKCKFSLQDFAGVIECFQKVLATEEGRKLFSDKEYCLLAQAYTNQNNLSEATAYWNTALDINPNNIAALSGSAFNYASLNKFEEALLRLDTAINLSPDKIDSYILRAFCLQQLGRIDETIKTYEKIIELDDSPDQQRANASRKEIENLQLAMK